MKTNSRFWVHLYWLLLSLLLLFPSNSFGQVISIDEFLQTNLASREITETFSYDCPDKYYSSTHSDKYLSMTLSRPRTTNTKEGSKAIYDPYRLVIFNSQGELLNMQPKYEQFRVAGFLEGDTDYYVFGQGFGDNSETGIYDMDGNLVKPLSCNGYCSPTGKFYYHQGAADGGRPLTIYDENGDRSFTIPTVGSVYKAAAASDSTLLLCKGTLALWNINTQAIIWEREFPGEGRYILDETTQIQFSIPGNIIALHGIYGYYCFNFQGDFLWADEDYSIHNNRLECTGVSKSSGDVVVIYTKQRRSHSVFAKIFNHEGILLEEHEIELGENVEYAGNSGLAAMVFSDYILIRISARTADQASEFATCILYKENQSWSSAVVSGFWFFLNKGSEAESLIGYDPRSQQIRGFQLK